MVHDASVLKISQKYMGMRDCTAQTVHCELLSLHCMCSLTHTETSERINCAEYGVDKYSD